MSLTSDTLQSPARMLNSLERQTLVYWSLLNRELAATFDGGDAFSAVAHILEPVFHIAVVLFWHWLMRLIPVYGTSKVLFISSGMYPLFVFIHTSMAFTQVSTRDAAHRRFPRYNMFDAILAKATIKVFLFLIVGVLLYGGIYFVVTPQALPSDPLKIIVAMAVLATMGVGAGMCNAAIETVFELWPKIYGPLARTMVLFGGVLYVPDFLPDNIRRWVAVNPVMHGVELFRQGFYPLYPKIAYNPSYMFASAAVSVVLGITLLRVMRARLED